ncbi:hypothetical protein C7974DRAFT_426732 [Boeremia exigua]|uniref:uncharacterized protein n=1 Tax=Boeremia exigua TaxID=749465 RepID=UPI001E8CCF7F|nr:uncharacterized protein C7974DRAFT_426732 [Boeremia exigua]KAH6620599.1 hypothetical protein C7974DRAFT_426732 [Boeremia exigua]
MQNSLLILLALASTAFTSPLETSLGEIKTRDITMLSGEESILSKNAVGAISSMEFIGPITPGGPDVHLFGTSKAIYEQIMALNPAYDVFDFPSAAAKLEAQGFTRENIGETDVPAPPAVSVTAALKVRNVLKRQDGINCMNPDRYATYPGCTEGINYLRRLGTGACVAEANSCARVSCSWDCGMWLCGKHARISVHCQDIANDVQIIRAKCFKRSDSTGLVFAGGRREFWGHNVEFNYINC